MTLEWMWQRERRLWLDGPGAYHELMHSACIMVFGPAGILDGARIAETLEGIPRWREVVMHDRRAVEIGQGVVVLAYRAEANRAGEASYLALCSSTYVATEEGWKIVQHQQTSID